MLLMTCSSRDKSFFLQLTIGSILTSGPRFGTYARTSGPDSEWLCIKSRKRGNRLATIRTFYGLTICLLSLFALWVDEYRTPTYRGSDRVRLGIINISISWIAENASLQ